MCDDYGTARSVEDHLVADLDVQEAHEDDGIYRLNERLLSARSHSATVEVCESECPDGEVFEEWIFSNDEGEDQHEFDTASDMGAGSECSAVHEVKAGTIVPVLLTCGRGAGSCSPVWDWYL